MQQSQSPTKFGTVFAQNAPTGNINNPIPVTPQIGGLASLETGFAPINSTQVAAGGIPPWGADENGIHYMETAALQWEQAGAPWFYDAGFAADVGGYPEGAFLDSTNGPGLAWVSAADNNTGNPDAAAANWLPSVIVASSNRVNACLSTVYTYAGNPNGNLPGTAATSASST